MVTGPPLHRGGPKKIVIEGGFLDFLSGLQFIQELRLILSQNIGSGVGGDVALLFLCWSAWAALLLVLAVVHYSCCVQRRHALLNTSWIERSFRAAYIIPESHRYEWHNASGTGFIRDAGTACCVCACPCLQIPETWHVGGALNYWTGIALCSFGPICYGCFGNAMRARLAETFGIARNAVLDPILWCFCCWGAAYQEAVHVKGALAEIKHQSMVAQAEKAMIAREMGKGPRVRLELESSKKKLEKLAALEDNGVPALEDMPAAPEQVAMDVAPTPTNDGNGNVIWDANPGDAAEPSSSSGSKSKKQKNGKRAASKGSKGSKSDEGSKNSDAKIGDLSRV